MEQSCNMCSGPLTELGNMGKYMWWRCRHCGWEQPTPWIADNRQTEDQEDVDWLMNEGGSDDC